MTILYVTSVAAVITSTYCSYVINATLAAVTSTAIQTWTIAFQKIIGIASFVDKEVYGGLTPSIVITNYKLTITIARPLYQQHPNRLNLSRKIR